MNKSCDAPVQPSTVARAEFMKDISDLINNTKLPFFVIEYILKDVIAEVKSAAQQQYEYDREQYESALASKHKDESDNEE